jgi:trehalose 6-phosphate synthase
MRTILRWGAPLAVVLAALAWGATLLVHQTARTWFERDVSTRARLAVSGARRALVERLASDDPRRLGAVLADLAGDERIMGATVCGVDDRTIATTGTVPQALGCEALADRLRASAGPEGLEVVEQADGGLVHALALPLGGEDGPHAHVVVVHDLGFLARREQAMQRFTLGAFAVVALLASIFTVVVRRASWRDWNDELRRVLTLGRGPRPAAGARKAFKPLLSDVRELVSELAAAQTGTAAGKWSPERLHRTVAEVVGDEGVVVVANREPYVHDRAKDGSVQVRRPASGLVTALEPVMRACGGTWIAQASGTADRAVVDRHDRIRVPPGEESYAIRRLWLTEREEWGYYYGFSNEGLWPLCHMAHTRPRFRAQDFREYERVNRRFAEAACEEAAGPDPIVLVQDYHYALAPRMIRERLPRATIIAFWHIPWPNGERFGICPWANELLDGMLGASVVGFHTQAHCNNFVDSVDRYLEARIDRERHSIFVQGREVLVRAYPISIEWPSAWARAAPPVDACRRAVRERLGLAPNALLGVGVDRLDYTKGIEERILAVERLLERFPRLRRRFTFAQIAAPSRTLIPEYQELSQRVQELAAHVNERFGDDRWRPIALLRSHHEPAEVFELLRAADVCYVSSLHDGMNLVAKEFVAARDDERGVLVLSRFTGAASELTEALLVNPYDVEEASSALATALAMPPEEQRERMRAMRSLLQGMNVYRWAGRMLTDASRLRQRDRLSRRLGPGWASEEART